jgi:hypothetical protein
VIFRAPIRRYDCYLYICLILLLLKWQPLVQAQTAPSATGGANSGVYALFDGGRPNFGSNWLVGGTVGGYFQSKSLLGLDGKVAALRWGPSQDHQYFALIGPRFAFNRGRWTSFGTAEGGIGHARYFDGSGYGASWMLTGGLDIRINSRLRWRVGQFSYGGIDVLNHGLNPKIISSGVVIKLF